jgi:hypothetical protein
MCRLEGICTLISDNLKEQSKVTDQSILNIYIWATFTKFIKFTFTFTAVQSEAGKLCYREHRLVEAIPGTDDRTNKPRRRANNFRLQLVHGASQTKLIMYQ